LIRLNSKQIWLEIPLSAGAFGLAHVCIYTQANAAWTFFPGLLFAWLYTRTNTLTAPILFHGLANSCYYLFLWYLSH
jgi:membrane protease YdiL (CAAX protease family)